MSNKPNLGRQTFKKRGIHMAENKNQENQNQNNPKPEGNETTKPEETKMTKTDGFFVRHAESLDKWTGRALKGIGIVAGGAAAFCLGMLVGKGSSVPDDDPGMTVGTSSPVDDGYYGND